MQKVDAILMALGRSEFRRRFALSAASLRYLHEHGRSSLRRQTRQILAERIGPANPPNDGKQTPMRGHPVFVAQHATATCCRECLAKWHDIAPGQPLSKPQIDRLVVLIERWMTVQVDRAGRSDESAKLFDDPADRW